MPPSIATFITLSVVFGAEFLGAQAPTQAPTEFRFAREAVLGSSSSLVVTAANPDLAARAEQAVFAEVDRLAQVVSTWDSAAELARLVHDGGGKPSAELGELLTIAIHWREASQHAFEPGVAVLTTLWSEAAQRGVVPTAEQLRPAVAAAADAFHFVGGSLAVHGPITLDAVAKGFVVERAVRVIETVPEVHLVSFQIGGDMRLGVDAAEVLLADPRQPADNAAPLCRLRVTNAAVASSGGYARGVDVAAQHHSHVLDPRTGKPCDGVLGASVVADDAATADVLATLLCVLGPDAGLKLLATVPHAQGVLVTADGRVHQSPGLQTLTIDSPSPVAADDKVWPQGFGLQIDFEIKAPATAGGGQRGGWRRPYVAVWIEDLLGEPVCTLCLWVENRRWLRELRRWSREHGDVDTFAELHSSATRKAGSYHLTWNGTDEVGRQQVAGRYVVCIEAAREHGSYQLMRKEVELLQAPQTIVLDGNEEIATATLTFGKKADKVVER